MRHFFDLLETPQDKQAHFDSVSLALASPEQIRAWSFGEVKAPETINYRTFKPENGGLFCAKIFGPLKDYECLCGKYKRTKIRHRGLTCEKCGVEVTTSRVRRERMGHIELASPVAHILYFKSLPSRIGLALNMTMRDIERVLYFEAYVVIDPRRAPLEPGQMLTIEEFQRYELECRGDFVAGIGGEGLRDYLKSLDLDSEAELLREEMTTTTSTTRRKKAFKRLKLVESLRQAGLRPEWMILEALPVLPPDLRPLVQLDGGRFTTSDLNDLYRRVINRNNRLRRLMELNAPSVIVNNEKRMLQEAVDSLLDNGRRGKPVLGSNRRPLKSLADVVKGKSGRFRQNLLGKRVDFSGRSVIVVGPNLKLHQCGLPKQMALTLFRPFLFHRLITDSHAANIRQAKIMIEREEPAVWDVLEDVIKQHPVMLNRAPTLHRLGIQAFEPVLIEGKAIQLHPLVCVAFNADFDGDQMAIHVPLSLEAQAEARVLMLSSNNILAPANGDPIIIPTQDVVLGIYYATRERLGRRGEGMAFADVAEVERALEAGAVELHSKIKLLTPDEGAEFKPNPDDEDPRPPMALTDTTPGRALLWRALPKGLPFSLVNRVLKKRDLSKLVEESFNRCGLRETVIFSDRLMRLGFEMATRAGVSICMNDMPIPEKKSSIIADTQAQIDETRSQFDRGLLTPTERYNKSVDLWAKADDDIARAMMDGVSQDAVLDQGGAPVSDKGGRPQTQPSLNSIFMMADSGARGSPHQMKQLAGMRGLMPSPGGRIMENPVKANFREGMSVLEFFVSTHGQRKGLTDTALKTANGGYMTRRLVDVTQDLVIAEEDCGVVESDTPEPKGIHMRAVLMGGEEVVRLRDRIFGRFTAEDVKTAQSDEVLELTLRRGADADPLWRQRLTHQFLARDIPDPEGPGILKMPDAEGEPKPLAAKTEMTRDIAQFIAESGVGEVLVRIQAGAYISSEIADFIVEKGVDEVLVRSPVTCMARRGICMKCYGRDLARGLVARMGEAVGVIAAQSIGEPGTQLTLRTFHQDRGSLRDASVVQARNEGRVDGVNIRHVTRKTPSGDELVVVSRGGELELRDAEGRERERHRVQYGDILKFPLLPAQVSPGSPLLERDPLVRPEVAEYEGKVKFENITVGDNARELQDETTGLTSLEIIGSKRAVTESGKRKSRGKSEEKRPQVKFLDAQGREVQTGAGSPVIVKLRAGHILAVSDGQQIRIGDTVARMPKEDVVKSGDITGGLPRVVELFEAREPKEPAILAQAKGVVTLEEPVRNKQQVVIRDSVSGESHVQLVPKGRAVLVQTGSEVERGEEIVEGAVNPHAILREQGVEKLTDYIVAHVQEVYRLQGVTINDKHIEVIVRQMLRNVEIVSAGDSRFIEGDQISVAEATRENERLRAEGKKGAEYLRILLGITKASLATDSFFSAASFQETTKVITEASLAGRSDPLRGLKENVIIGRLIPAGTGYVHYREQERGEEIELRDLLVQEGAVEAETETEAEAELSEAPPPTASPSAGG